MTKENMKRIIQLDGLISEGECKLKDVQDLDRELRCGCSQGRLKIGGSLVIIENHDLLKCLVDITSVSFKAQIARLEKELEEL